MGREIGNSTRAAVAINPESGGTSFGQTPGTKTVFTTLAGGAKWEKKQAKTTLTLMGFQERFVERGGTYYAWTISVPASYEYLEHLWLMFFGGSITTSAFGSIYKHVFTLTRKPRFGALYFYSQDEEENAGEVHEVSLLNCLCGSVTLQQAVDKIQVLTFSGISTEKSEDHAVAAVPAETGEPALIDWEDLCGGIELNGVTDFEILQNDIVLTRPLTEGKFAMRSANCSQMPTIANSGLITVRNNINTFNDDNVKALCALNQTTGANSYEWDNGLTLANQKTNLWSFGPMEVLTHPRDVAVYGVQEVSIALQALKDSSDPAVAMELHNARSTIPA